MNILKPRIRESGEDHIAHILEQKSEAGSGNHTVWMVSNCDATRGAVVRQQFVSKLVDNGLKLDGYGECFDNVLVDSPWMSTSKTTYHWGLFSKYKFYLAFENSIHCNGYISEKVWRNSLDQGLVPIIYGPHQTDVKVNLCFFCVKHFHTRLAVNSPVKPLFGQDRPVLSSNFPRI